MTVFLDDHVALASEDTSGSEFLVEVLNDGGRTNKKGSSGISDGLSRVQGLSVDANGINVEFPIGLRSERNESEVSSVVGRVNTTKDQLTTLTIVSLLSLW